MRKKIYLSSNRSPISPDGFEIDTSVPRGECGRYFMLGRGLEGLRPPIGFVKKEVRCWRISRVERVRG
ncbi:hypothetical protein KKA02_01410 [Patescibacteria group bacterium]|nr:hypothetical protein [Patescibacteria group bacterium]